MTFNVFVVERIDRFSANVTYRTLEASIVVWSYRIIFEPFPLVKRNGGVISREFSHHAFLSKLHVQRVLRSIA